MYPTGEAAGIRDSQIGSCVSGVGLYPFALVLDRKPLAIGRLLWVSRGSVAKLGYPVEIEFVNLSNRIGIAKKDFRNLQAMEIRITESEVSVIVYA